MEDGRCPTCGHDMQWDDVSEIWFCDRCNRLYDEGEASSSTEWFISSVLMFVPGVNIILAMCTKDRLKRTIYTNMFMSSVVSLIVLSIGLVIWVYNFKGNLYENLVHSRDKIATIMFHELDVEVPEFRPTKLPDLSKLVIEEDEELLVFTEDMAKYIDDSFISGSKVREIIKSYDKYYLISTFTVREKYGPSIYLPVGKVFDECEKEESLSQYRYDISKHSTYTESDKYEDISLIDNKKIIYYIYPTSYFKVKVIRDKDDVILGLQFTEEVM